MGLLAWTCTGDSGEPVQNAGAVESESPPPPPTVMPTVTVTTTTSPEPEAADDGGPCKEKDLVYGMSASGKTYSGSSSPQFQVTVVNAGNGSCTFGTGDLDVRITSGEDRIWSSAECRDGDPSKETLKRGIPYIETVTWNRKRGCGGEKPARPGTYVADLKGKKTKKQIFHLR